MEKNLKKNRCVCVCVCVCETESLCCTPETEHCKSTILQQQQSIWRKKNTFYTFYLILPLSCSTKTTKDLAQSPWVLVKEKQGNERKATHTCFFVPPNRMHPEALTRNHKCVGQSIQRSLAWHLFNSGFVKGAARTLQFWPQNCAGL